MSPTGVYERKREPCPECGKIVPVGGNMRRHRDMHNLRVERIMARVRLEPPPPGVDGDCWIYTGGHTPAGYGRLSAGEGRYVLTHRAIYEAHHGALASEAWLHHRCERPACCNHAHMKRVDRYSHPAEHRVTHCKQGHPFDATNTWIDKKGARHCRTCSTERARRRRTRPPRPLTACPRCGRTVAVGVGLASHLRQSHGVAR